MNLWQQLVPETLEFPQRLLALLAIPLLAGAYLLLSRRHHRKGMRFTNAALLQLAMPGTSQWRRHLAVVLALLSLVTLTVAWAQPTGIDRVRVERATVVIVLDVSQSMAANDVPPSRIEAAKAAAIALVDGVPENYNVALVALSGDPSIVVPPTLNRSTMTSTIEQLPLRDASSIGESIVLALSALGMAPRGENEEPPPGAIVLLSDGENTSGRPGVQGAAEAADQDVPIYTVAYGTENGYVDLDGRREPVPVNSQQLAEIAQRSGGAALRASSDRDLERVYDTLRTEVGYVEERRDVTARYALYAGVFALLAALATISLSARWPT